MGKRTKRALSLFLVLVIIVTSVGYTPPINSLASSGDNQSIEDILWDEKATPSEADYSYKATPSEADSLTNATKSEAEKNFVKVEPKDEEIPKFYSRATDLKNQFWQFEDRYGVVQYRDYGYFNGETESPHWYCLTSDGNLDIDDNSQYSDNVDLEDEYITLAPYLYKSVQPDQKAWTNLSWKLLNDSESIFLFDREESESFENWDHSTYAIWSVNGLVESDEKTDDEIQNTDLGYFFYGQILNERDSVEQWYYADINGSVWPMRQFKTMMLMAEAPTTCKLTFDANGGTIYNSSTYEKDLTINTAMTYSDMNAIKSNVNRAGYTFDGWNYQPDGSGSNFYDSTKVTSDTTIYAKWRKNQYTVMFYRNYPIGDTTTYKYKSVYFGDPIGTFMDAFPVGKGMEFKGWYLNQYCSGDPVTPEMLMGNSTLNLYGKWENFDVTYKMHYGYGIDETTLPAEIKAKSTVVGQDLAKYYFPDLINSSKLYAPGYVDGYWTDTSDMNSSGSVISAETSSSWYPKDHVTNIYLKKAVKRVIFDLYYPPSDYPKNKYSSSSWPIGSGGTKYGDIIWPKDLSDIMAYVRSDKKFVGLFTDPEQNNEIDLSKPICPSDKQDKKDLVRYTVYLGVANQSSKITFKDWDGSIISEKTVNYGDPIEIPPNPSRSGYRFLGWDKDLNENTKIGIDTVITAQYVENGFRINLYANGGKFEDIDPETGTTIQLDTKTIKFEDVSDINDVIKKSNEFLNNQFKNLKRSGYEPDWYDSASLGNPISSITESDILSGKKDIYAQWKSVYLVKFVNWNGSVLDQQYVKAGSNAILPKKPKRANYIFKKWSSSHLNIQGNKTLTAVFISARSDGQKEWYTIRNNPNEADTQSQFEDKQYLGDFGIQFFEDQKDYYQNFWQYDDEKIELKELRHEGDIFLGWVPTFRFLYNDVLNPLTNDSQYVKNWKNNPPQLYANYTFQGLRSDMDNRNDRIPGAPILSKNISLPTRSFHQISGLTFYGLWIPENKPSLILINGYDYMGLAPFNNNNKDLFNSSYDIWEDNVPYFESISVADYFGQNIMEKFKKGTDKLSLPVGMRAKDFFGPGANYYEKTHVLVGYFSEPDGNGKRLDSTYTFDKVDDRYYAYYVPINEKYHVQFQDESGNIISEMDINAGSAITNSPNAPLKEDYTLLGWYNITDELSTINNICSNVIFKPKYEKEEKLKFDLTIDANGGCFLNDESIKMLLEQKEVGSALNSTIYEDNGKIPSMKHYKFNGWYSNSDNANSNGRFSSTSENYMPNNNLILYAHWTRNEFKVTYVDYLGNEVYSEWVAKGSNSPTPPSDLVVKCKVGEKFYSWETASNINSDITLKANYAIKGGDVPVDSDGGTILGQSDFAFHTIFTITEDEIKTLMGNWLIEHAYKEGYTLVGFDYTESGVRKSGLPKSIPPTYDIIIHLIWSKNKFNVKYVDWNGYLLKSEQVEFGAYSTPPINPIRSGYTFTGWLGNYNNVSENTTIIAQYSKNNYTLTLDPNGGKIYGDNYKYLNFDFGESIDQAISEASNNVSREYHSFDGWYTLPYGGSKINKSGNTMPDANTILYAHWTKTYKHIIWKDENGNIIDDGWYPIDNSKDIVYPTPPNKQGYHFDGWSSDPKDSNDDIGIYPIYNRNKYTLSLNFNNAEQNDTFDINFEDSIQQKLTESSSKLNKRFYKFDKWEVHGNELNAVPELMPANNLTLDAKWLRVSSLVTWKDWDGSIIDETEVPIGGSLENPQDPTRVGYDFVGWSDVASNVTDHKIIVAQYSSNKYLLTLDGNGGTLNGQNLVTKEFSYNESFDQTLIDSKDILLRTYYVFDGWYTDPLGGKRYSDNGNAMPTSALTIYAHWARSSSLVTYKDWNGTVLKTQEVPIGKNATPPEDPERAGYTFAGWDKISTDIQDHTIITAKYTINGYKLTLDGNGGMIDGKATKEQGFVYNESIDQMLKGGEDSINRKYYNFDGWYTEAAGGDKYTYIGNTMPASNLTIYAHWTRTSSLVTYKDWDGTVLKTQEVVIKADATPPENPNRTGYTFIGWDHNSSGIEDHTIITAQYTINNFMLILNGNGGTVNGNEMKLQTIPYGESFDQMLIDGRNEASREYYDFNGWFTMPVAGDEYAYSGNKMPDTNLTIYAHWVRSSSLVTYKDWNGAIIKSQKVSIGEDATPPEIPNRTGYTFVGWDKSSSNIQDHTIITAQYSTNKNRVILDGNGGTFDGDPIKTQEINYGELFDQLLINGKNIVSQKYFTFDGWYSSPTGGEHYSYTGNIMPNSDITIYAHWVRNYVTVTYKDWDGKILKTQKIAEGSDAASPVEPDRVGYAFAGWDKPSTDIQFDTVITAQYTINFHTLSLSGNGGLISGSATKDQSFSYGESFDQILIDERSNASRVGYTFAGWFSHPTEGSLYSYSGNSMPDSNITIYAHWIPNKYTIHFEKNLSNIEKNPADRAVIYGGVIGELPVLNAKGYTFDGWYTEAIDGNKIGADTPSPLGDKTYYGHWILNWIDNGDGTHTRPGTDNTWNTDDDEIWQNGPDGSPGTDDDYKKIDENPSPEPTKPEPTKPEPSKASEDSSEDNSEVTYPVIDSKIKPTVPDTGGTFTVNPNNPYDVTYTKPDGTLASDEWVGDGKEWYHVGTNGKLNYDWYLEGQKTWYKLNKDPGEKFGTALIGWNYESMDDKMYFFDPKTTQMLTGWQNIDGYWYYFTPANEAQTYFGNNSKGWLYDSTRPGKPYGSMYKKEKTPDGYNVDENGKWIK
ncbi:InlB B-repeat-containing protein [Lacrimispora amygdalina]|uniref:InlB B-repeat-containing protein n=1 Tax=Lacrimispora amygdalina TaxID=253257 RepID=UPI000BE255E5|nr:InlB B-repeat-containing protein [Lacrimispora amygdalina]